MPDHPPSVAELFEHAPEAEPEPPAAPAPGPTPARYAYLVGRLRNRQITMEEATELFALQQQLLDRVGREPIAARPPPAPPPPPAGLAGSRAPSGPASRPAPDALWEALPVVAAAAGILAALLKRGRAPAEPAGRAEPTPPPR
jgi:hypothetical protein